MDDNNLDILISGGYHKKIEESLPSEDFFASIALRTVRVKRRQRILRICSACSAVGIAATLAGIVLTAVPESASTETDGEALYTESISLADERLEHICSTQAELRETYDAQFPF